MHSILFRRGKEGGRIKLLHASRKGRLVHRPSPMRLGKNSGTESKGFSLKEFHRGGRRIVFCEPEQGDDEKRAVEIIVTPELEKGTSKRNFALYETWSKGKRLSGQKHTPALMDCKKKYGLKVRSKGDEGNSGLWNRGIL